MKIDFKKILYFILLVVIQLIIDNYLNLGPYIYLFIVPYLILTLPYKYKTISTMVMAFMLGLLIDVLSNGVIGLNAGALTAMAFLRHSFIQILVNEQSMGKYESPSLKGMGFSGFSLYILLSYLTFFITYILFDNFGSGLLLFCSLKIIISCLANTVLIIILSSLIQERR